MKINILLYFKGLAMGAADVVPGVSGGTIAFITGIYEELLTSIKSFDVKALKLLFKFQLSEFAKKVNLIFLLTLLSGIATSIILFSRIIPYLLTEYKELVWAFFFGLVLGSTILVINEIKNKTWGVALMGVLGAVLAYFITEMGQTETPTDLWFIFLCGSIAICAMILPGISGSFVLVLLGKYEYIFGAVKEAKLTVIAAFGAGCALGILAFSHVLTWLLRRYHDLTVGLLAGFMLGSLNKIWPWKHTLKTYFDRHGVEKPLIQIKVSPFEYQGEAYFWGCVLLCVLGFLLVYGIDRLGKKLKLG
jgi:putative membrane protein